MHSSQSPLLSRRKFFTLGTAAGLSSLILPRYGLATAAAERAVKLYNMHTGEWFHGPYWIEGEYLDEAFVQIKHFMRDRRNDKVHDIAPELIDLLNTLQKKVGAAKPFELVCGFRSPETNTMLRKKKKGIARNSLHMTGHAVDIRLKDYKLRQLRDIAKAQKKGGVGYYPKSGFIHVDIRDRPTYW